MTIPLKNRYVCLLILLTVSFNEVSVAQVGNGTIENSIVTRVRYVGNSNIRTSTLKTITRTKTNRELLSIPGVTFWYWLNQLNNNWGEPSSKLNRTAIATDIDRITAFYRSQGYLQTTVDTLIVEFSNRRFEVSFFINEGKQSVIQHVMYSGFPILNSAEREDIFFESSQFKGKPVNDSTLYVNTIFTYDKIGTERSEIINFLKNNGYASVIRDSVRAIVQTDSLDPTKLNVLFKIRSGPVYTFGDLYLNLDGPSSNRGPALYDTLDTPLQSRIFTRIETEAKTNSDLLLKNLRFEPGAQFNQDLYLQTIRRYQNLGMLTVRQFNLSSDGSLPDYSSDSLPVRIDLQTLPRQRIRSDIFGMQRLGFGAGAGVSYINNNLWGSAEMVEIGLKGSFENAPNVSSGLLRSLEASIEYSVPELNFPFKSFTRRPAFINSRTRYQISVAQINQLNFDVNANIRFNLKFEVYHSQTVSSILDFIELDWFDASPSERFRRRIEEEITDPLQRERILNDFSQQFSSTMRYTIRTVETDFVKRNRGFLNEASFEFGGNIPYLIEKYLVRPGEPLDGTIPSLTLSDSTLSYARFVKFYVDHRIYRSVFENTVVAWRGFAGAAYAYAETRQIPLNRRFFAGGSNDIRGWPPLRLGPGDVSLSRVTYNGGDIKLATFLELRQLLISNFLNTNWGFALFTDAGNIWYGPRSDFSDGRFNSKTFLNEIAVGYGYGLRLDWDFVVFRIDAGFRAYDPARDDGVLRGWFNNRNAYIHFGIGHAF